MPKEKFDWRNHIEFSDDTYQEFDDKISAVLDLMFIDRDGDGKIDNKHARKLAENLVKTENIRGGKIEIANESNSNLYDPFKTKISIDYDSIKNLGYVDMETGKLFPVSVNRTLFHELVHATQDVANLDSEYDTEQGAANLTSLYMNSVFGEPLREKYILIIEGYLSEPPKDALIYGEGDRLINHLDLVRDLTYKDLSYFNDELLKNKLSEMLLGMENRNVGLRQFLDKIIGTEGGKDALKEYISDTIAESWVEKKGGLEKVLENGELQKFLELSIERNIIETGQNFINDIQEFNLKHAKKIIDKHEKSMEEKSPDKSKNKEMGLNDFGDLDLNSLKGLKVEGSSVAGATTGSAKYSPVEIDEADKSIV